MVTANEWALYWQEWERPKTEKVVCILDVSNHPLYGELLTEWGVVETLKSTRDARRRQNDAETRN